MSRHWGRGNETESGEVSDPGCSRPAAAMLDVRARMFTAQTLSRAASLTLRCSVLCHIQQMSAAMIQHSASGNETKSGDSVWVRGGTSPGISIVPLRGPRQCDPSPYPPFCRTTLPQANQLVRHRFHSTLVA